jgi:hypothetical protein
VARRRRAAGVRGGPATEAHDAGLTRAEREFIRSIARVYVRDLLAAQAPKQPVNDPDHSRVQGDNVTMEPTGEPS